MSETTINTSRFICFFGGAHALLTASLSPFALPLLTYTLFQSFSHFPFAQHTKTTSTPSDQLFHSMELLTSVAECQVSKRLPQLRGGWRVGLARCQVSSQWETWEIWHLRSLNPHPPRNYGNRLETWHSATEVKGPFTWEKCQICTGDIEKLSCNIRIPINYN